MEGIAWFRKARELFEVESEDKEDFIEALIMLLNRKAISMSEEGAHQHRI